MLSTRKKARVLGILCATLFGAALFLGGESASYGQMLPPTSSRQDPQPSPSDKDKDLNGAFGNTESEMRAKLILKEEKKRYDENLARAREAAQMASQLRTSYESRKSFSPEDSKKLERLEKLTRKLRNEAGGSDTDPDAKDLPAAMDDAVKRVAEVAEDLRKEIEKTPRRVVSAGVIDQANKLIGLIQYVRNERP